MSAPSVAEKSCKGCGVVKPLSEFYKHPTAADGRAPKCRTCAIDYQKQRRKQRREEMGEEAWLEYQRKIRMRSYYNGRTSDKEQRAAWVAAQKRLRQAHPKEFDALYREERYERGLPVNDD